VLIVRAFGGHPAATSAVMSGLDATGIEFAIDGGVIARVPFASTLTARPQVRGEVTRLFHEAQAALGMKPAFSIQLRDATADLHDKATQVPYLGELMQGKLDAEAYAEMVAQHWYAYRELEGIVVANPGDPIVQAFHLPPLTRLPKIEDDLAELLGPQWQDRIAPNEATTRYTTRIREVCTRWPGGFVAHHYTRYLGDLSGGQFIRKVVDRTIGAGTSFYDFSDLGDLAAFKEDYRHLLDATSWGDAERERIVAESRIAYELNIEVLEQLRTT
jgi:heme oxygenase